jgi:hypothetical protein
MSADQPPEADAARKEGWRGFAPVIGFGFGGCLIPFLLFLFCFGVLHDTGGPLFWPIIAAPMAIIGLVIGIVVRSSGKTEKE